MNKVVVQTYAAVVILVLLLASTYVLYDLSRLSGSNYTQYREKVTELAMIIRSGGTPEPDDLTGILRIDLVQGEHERVLYRSKTLSSSLFSLINGTYEYPVGSGGTDTLLRIRSSLIEREELVARLRILLYTGSAAVLLSALILAFTPGSPQRGGERIRALSAPIENFSDSDSDLMPGEELAVRLESELKRAASFDQDLSLAVISFAGLDPHAGLGEVSQEIRRFFVFRDLCYEYGPAQVCLLLPNTELDDGIRSVRDFRKELEKERAHIRICSGLSSRNGRLLDPECLLTEADSALEKSLNDPDRAVFGFRADPKKYRARLAEAT